jgi:hypothetical protein
MEPGIRPISAGRKITRLAIIVGMLLTVSVLFPPFAAAQGNDANKILKAMSDFMTSQKAFSLTYDSDIEVITTDLQKIQFASSGQVQVIRPDKLRATRTGGYKDVELVFDGKTLSVNSKDSDTFAQLDAPGSIDQVVDLLRNKYAVTAPGTDLLFSRPFDILTGNVIDAKHIGQGVIDGVECEHLAFRTPEMDWQIWIERGARPIPRKYVITSKTVTGAPQYTLRIKEWRPDAAAAGTFAFKPPQGAKKVAFEALQIDEVPPGVTATGGKK